MTAAMCAVFLTACANTEETAPPVEETVAEIVTGTEEETESEAAEVSSSEASEEETAEETAAEETDEVSEDGDSQDIPEEAETEDILEKLDQSYLRYANAVMRAEGEGESISEDKLTLSTYWDGDEEEAAANEERSILWASDYGTISVRELNATSTSSVNYEKLSELNGLDEENMDIASEWGVNAVLLATDGGTITVGNDEDDTSSFYANGDGTIGAYAGGTGDREKTGEAPALTSIVDVRNADFIMDGWKNHVACAAYGGYVSLRNVNATTGILGSYSIGASSALYAGYGSGIVEADGLKAFTYGNESHGAYVSGDGMIIIRDSALTSMMGSGLMIDSGGALDVTASSVSGQTGLKVRGDVKGGYDSVFENVSFTAQKDLSAYVTGDKAKKAADAWVKANNSVVLSGDVMEDTDMTLGDLLEEYEIGEEEGAAFIEELSEISGTPYSSRTFLRNSVLDNTYYDHDNGCYLTGTDYSDIPYLTVGASNGGYVSSVLSFVAADVSLRFDGCSFRNMNTDDHAYLIAAEAGSSPELLFKDSKASGIIWNEGDVNRYVYGNREDYSSTLHVTFDDSDLTGSFADGSNGLWDIYVPVEEDEISGAEETDDEYITVLNGNYYGAEGNFGISASFIGESVWTVTHDSYLGDLMIGTDARIEAPEGYSLKMTVDGEETDIAPGMYTGKVILELIPEKEN